MRHLKIQHAFLALLLLALAGCAGHKQLYRHATDLPSATRVALLHHNALGETVLAVRADPLVSEPTKAKLRDAYRKTVCSKVELANGLKTEDCSSGPAQVLEGAGRAYDGLVNAQTQAELNAALDALNAALIDLINLTGGKS